MTPFPPKLLSYLKSLFPDAASPLSRFVPLLSTVLSSLNEPELILELFDDACLNLVDSFQPPDWIEVVGGKSLSAQVLGKLIIAVRSREALLKVTQLFKCFVRAAYGLIPIALVLPTSRLPIDNLCSNDILDPPLQKPSGRVDAGRTDRG